MKTTIIALALALLWASTAAAWGQCLGVPPIPPPPCSEAVCVCEQADVDAEPVCRWVFVGCGY